MRKKILWIAGSLLLSIVLLLLFLHSSFVKTKALDHLKHQLARSFNLSLSAESLDYNLFSLRVSLKKLSLGTRDDPSLPPFFQAEQATLYLTPALLLGKKIDFKAVQLEKPVISIHVYPNHTSNIPPQLFPESQEPSLPLILRLITVNNGSLIYNDPANNLRATLRDFHLEGFLPGEGKKELIFRLFPSPIPKVSPLPGTGSSPGGSSVVYRDHTFRLDQSEITVQLDNRAAQVSLKGNYLPGDEPFAISGQVHWDPHRWSIPQFRITLAGGLLSGNVVDLPSNSLDLNPPHLKAKSQELRANSKSPLEGARAAGRLSLTWKDLNLQSPLLTSFFSHPVHSRTSGSLDLTIPELSFKSLQGNAAATLSPLKTPDPKPGSFPLTGEVSLRLSPGHISIPNFNLSALGNNLRGKLAVKDRSFQAEVSGFLKNDPPISGHLRLSGQVNGDLANPIVLTRLESNGLRIGSLMELVAKGTLKYEKGRLITDNLLVQAKDALPGQVTISGTLPLGTPPSGSPNPLDIIIKAKDIPLEQLLRYLNEDFPACGTLSVDAHLLPQKHRASFCLSEVKITGNTPSSTPLSKTAKAPPESLDSMGLPAETAFDLGDITGDLELVDDRLGYKIEAPDLFTEIEGSGRTASPFPITGTLRVDIPGVEKLAPRKGFEVLEGISGPIKSRVNFQLDLAQPLNTVKAGAVIDTLSLRSHDHVLENQGPIRISFNPAGITLHHLELKGPGSHISGSGFLPMNSLRRPGGSFEKPPPGPPQNFLLPSGPWEFDSTLSPLLRAKNQEPRAALTFLARIDPALLDPFTTPLRFKGNLALRADITGSVSQPVLATETTLKEFTVEKPAPPGPGTDPGTRVLVEGNIRAAGNLLNPREFSAEAQFPLLQLQLPGMPVFRFSNPVTLRLENGRLQVLPMSLSDENDWSRLTISGTADLTGKQGLDFTVTGQVDARLAGLFLEDADFSGKSDLALRVGGELQKPVISGSLDMHHLELSLPGENLFINQVKGKLRFLDNRILVESLAGNFNGGSMTLEGEMLLGTDGFQNLALTFTTAGTYFEFPKGLFFEASARLNFSFDGADYLLKGTVDIDEGVYNEPFSVLSELTDYLRGSPAQATAEAGNFWERLNLDIGIRTASPVLIDTNVSRSELSVGLTLGGTVARPALAGRLDMKEGGEIVLGGNTFSIESGIIHFVNPYYIEPELRIRARGRVQGYDIVLSLTGTPSALSASFTSTPSLPQPSILALLMTGEIPFQGSGGANGSPSFLAYTGTRAMEYVSSVLSGSVGKLLKGKLGIESVRLDGSLIASRENPGARLTVGQRLTTNLELTLSQNLKQAQNRSWILDYKPLPYLTLQGRKQDKDNYTAALLVDFLFGPGGKKGTTGTTGEAAAKSPGKSTSKSITVKAIQIKGETGLPVSIIRHKLELKKGDTFHFFKYQGDLERLRKLYRQNHFLRADIQGKRLKEKGKITIRYTINAGPRIYLEFYGTNLPRGFRARALELWSDGRFDLRSTKNVEREIYRRLFEKGYYRARVTPGTPGKGNNFIRYTFNIQKGPKYGKARFLFQGNRQVTAKELNRFLKKNKLKDPVFYEPGQVVRELTRYYKEKGFLAVRVDAPVINKNFLGVRGPAARGTYENHSASDSSEPYHHSAFITHHSTSRPLVAEGLKKPEVEFLISEGPLARIGEISFTGNRYLGTGVLLEALGLKKGQVFSAVKLDEARYEITTAYAQKGFNQVRVAYEKQIEPETGRVDLEFRVEEKQRGVIREITITGHILTRAAVIRRELTFKEGDTLDYRQVNRSRKNLYDLGIFQWVNIDAQPLALTAAEKPGITKPFRVVIELSEIQPFRVKTGLQWDTEKALGAVIEMSSPNIAGKAHYLGTGFIFDKKETGFKGYYRFPYFFSRKIATEFFAFAGKKEETSYTINRKGLTLQQQYRPWRTVLFTCNYTWERDHITAPGEAVGPGIEPAANPGLDRVFNLGYLTAALTYDRRNSIVNPTRGFFLTGSMLVARKYLGSGVNFSRFYGEGHWYIPVFRFLVMASSIRAGAGRGLGQEDLPAERFFAGGGNTLRGFKESMVGPIDEKGNPLGGEALFIFKQELRARLNGLLGIVLFADFGNVYSTTGGFDFLNVRKSAGFGLRVDTGPLLLRIDWGFKLDRRHGESPSQVFFSIGQAF